MDNIRNRIDLLAQARPSLVQFHAFMRRIQPYIPGDVEDLKADHICIKCYTSREFEELRHDFESSRLSKYMYQSHIGGRRIAYFRLKVGLPTAHGMIDYLELCAPKRGESKPTDFHHIEIYLESTQNPHDAPEVSDIMAMLKQKDKKLQVKHRNRPHHETYDVDDKSGLIIRFSCTAGPLINKIVNEEMAD